MLRRGKLEVAFSKSARLAQKIRNLLGRRNELNLGYEHGYLRMNRAECQIIERHLSFVTCLRSLD